MSELQESTISPDLKLKSNIVAGAVLVLGGLFLLLCGLSIIPLSLSDILSTAIVGSFFVMFLVVGLMQKNMITTWLAFVLFAVAMVEFLTHYTSLTYGNLYFVYIAIPALSSLANSLIWLNIKPYIGAIVFFMGLGILFALMALDLVSWVIVVPILVVFVGACVVTVAVRTYKDEE